MPILKFLSSKAYILLFEKICFMARTLVPFCRFPFVACEIFTCEIDVILKTLVEEEEVRSSDYLMNVVN